MSRHCGGRCFFMCSDTYADFQTMNFRQPFGHDTTPPVRVRCGVGAGRRGCVRDALGRMSRVCSLALLSSGVLDVWCWWCEGAGAHLRTGMDSTDSRSRMVVGRERRTSQTSCAMRMMRMMHAHASGVEHIHSSDRTRQPISIDYGRYTSAV